MACHPLAPVVFLHGTAASPRQWRPLISHLEAFESFTLDLPSHMLQEVRAGQSSLSQEAQALVHRLRVLSQPFHLVGHSYGGALALTIAMQWPSLVRSLTLLEPAMFHLLRDGHPIERQMHADIAGLERDLRQAIDAGAPERAAARFIDFWNGPDSFAVYAPETQERVIQRMNVIVANLTNLDQQAWPMRECARVTCPTLGVFGENSPLLVQHLTRLIAGVMENAKVLSVSGAGHMLPVTHAETAAKFLKAHILAAEVHALSPRPRVA